MSTHTTFATPRRSVGGRRSAVMLLTMMMAAFESQVDAQIRPLDLGTLGGGSVALAVNVSGQVVGASNIADGRRHAFFWSATDGMIDLGTLGGGNSEARAVNASGQVIGISAIEGRPLRAFLWTATDGMTDLGTLGGDSAVAVAVNDSGQVVGSSSRIGNGSGHAFVWTAADGMIDLGTLGGNFSFATAVNASGQVVGSSETADGSTHAFSWSVTDGMIDLDTLGGLRSDAVAVNDSGQVVGSSDRAGEPSARQGFSWTRAGGMIDLGGNDLNNGRVIAVDASGRVIGYSDTQNIFRAFSWTAAGGKVLLSLANPNHDSSFPTALNARGQIVGYSFKLEFDEPDQEVDGISWTAKGGIIRLGDLGGRRSFPAAIDATGHLIVGESSLENGGSHAALWTVIAETLETRQPIADTYVRAGASASVNFGASPTLLVKFGLTPDFTRRGYVKFDISDVPTIGQATLRLHGRVSDARNSVRAGVFRVGNQSWDEQTVTYNTKPAYGPLLGIATVRRTEPQWVEIDVTAFVQAERQAGQDTISVALRALEHTSAYASFDSRETGEFGPQLVITP